jgi:fructokinase
VKLSDEDAAVLYPGWSVDAVCDRILRLGVGLFAMTLGDKGCVIASRDERIDFAALPVTVVDTIGAGDSFMSALLFAIIEGDFETSTLTGTFDPHTLADIATTCLTSAALTVSRAGAMPPTLTELQEALRAERVGR